MMHQGRKIKTWPEATDPLIHQSNHNTFVWAAKMDKR